MPRHADEPARHVAEASETRRQLLVRWLSEEEIDFETLRVELDLRPRELADELRHVERSVRRAGRRLRVRAPRCRDCGFDFPGRERKHLQPPGRCPQCRGQRILPPRFRVA